MNLRSARIFVRDLAEAHRFYAGLLALPLRAGGLPSRFCVYAAGACELIVEPVAADAPPDEQALVGRFTGLSFTVADIDATHRQLAARGVQFIGLPELQPWGGTLATLVDPAGNGLQLVQPPRPV